MMEIFHRCVAFHPASLTLKFELPFEDLEIVLYLPFFITAPQWILVTLSFERLFEEQSKSFSNEIIC